MISDPASPPGPAEPQPEHRPRPLVWPWFALLLGLVWTIAIRLPLLLNAHAHIDSDLAVDGLTLLDATRGTFRWHYPGTPHMGILPMFLSLPQALAWGATPQTLVSGGIVAWVFVVITAFVLAFQIGGARVAGFAILPLAASSVGTVWLSGRITGGHLLTLAWFLASLVILVSCLRRGGAVRWLGLGLVCGLGLYLDLMFATALGGIVVAVLAAWLLDATSVFRFTPIAAFVVGFLVGDLPRELGKRIDPYDAYNEQFSPILRSDVIAEHARILGLECVPRLVAGVTLPTTRLTPTGLDPSGRPLVEGRGRLITGEHAPTFAALSLLAFAASLATIGIIPFTRADPVQKAVALAITAVSLLVVVGFLINRNIFNSDNYRYLVFLLVPYSLGFGLLMSWLCRFGRKGKLVAFFATGLFLALSLASIAGWYTQLKWIDDRLLPIAAPRSSTYTFNVPLIGRPNVRMPYQLPFGASHILGDYWDVYRVAFLSEGNITGVPLPIYPNRFQGWSRELRPGQGLMVVLDPNARGMLPVVWERDGRDIIELDQIAVESPSQ